MRGDSLRRGMGRIGGNSSTNCLEHQSSCVFYRFPALRNLWGKSNSSPRVHVLERALPHPEELVRKEQFLTPRICLRFPPHGARSRGSHPVRFNLCLTIITYDCPLNGPCGDVLHPEERESDCMFFGVKTWDVRHVFHPEERG